MSQHIPVSIALIDFSHMLTVNFKAMANDAGPNAAGQVTLDQLAAMRSASEHTIICLDSPPYWRKTVYPDYKKGRERESEYGAILKWTLERIEADGYNIAAAPTEEADDVMATLARIYSEEYGCGDVRIVGADKDALQCVSDRVRCFVPKGRGEFDIRGPEWLKKELDVTPEDFPLLLAIMGDASDNIPGIKGLGKGHGAKLINIYRTPEGMAKGLVAAQEDASLNDKKLSAVWERFAAGCAELPKWLKLTTLNTHAKLELHPLDYLKKLPVQKLVEDDDIERDAIQGEFDPIDVSEADWDRVAEETAAREREELAKALPVEPRIGVDPQAAEKLKQAAAERDKLAAMNTNAPKTPERVAVTQERIESGNAAERERTNRHGVVTPDPAVMDVPPKASALPATQQPPAAQPASAPAAAPAAEVVPPTRGPRKGDEIPAPADLVRVAPPSWSLAVQPSSASEMLSIAKVLFNSRMYSQFGSERGVFSVMMLGRELGMGMAQALEAFHIVNDKPFMKATALQALASRDPDCVWIMITSSDGKHAVCKSQHRSAGLLEYTYTIERAALAKLTTGNNRHNWETKPQEMLEARAKSKASRLWYPSATFGMHSQEEALDD